MTEADGPVPPAGRYLALGEAMVAFDAPSGRRLEDTAAVAVHVAGAELNVAVGLSRLGVPSAFAGAVGDDPWGRRVRKALGGEGVEASALRVDPKRPTGLLFKEGTAGGALRVHYRRRGSAAAAYRGGAVLERLLADCRGLHLTGISLVVGEALRATSIEAVERLPEGAYLSFDLNVRRTLAAAPAWHAGLERVARRADLVLATVEELDAVGVDVPALGRDLAGRGGALLARDGAGTEGYAADGRLRVLAPPPVGPVVDTVGAGDAYAAAVIAMRLAGAGWEVAVRAGHLAGGFAVGTLGDYEGAPDARELDMLLGGNFLSR